MDAHVALEWTLVGGFLACGVRQAALLALGEGHRASPVLGLACLALAALAAVVHRLPPGLPMWIVMALAFCAAVYVRVQAHRDRTFRWMTAFADLAHVARRDGVASWPPGPVLPLLGLSILIAGVAGMGGIGEGTCLYGAALLPLLGVVVLADLRDERDEVRDSRPGPGNELSHASRLAVVGELTASIAHEINQPLSAILSNVDAADILLEDAAPPEGELQKIIRDIRRDGLRASDVIRNVRTLAQKRDPEMVRLDLGGVMELVVEILAQETRRRGVDMRLTSFRQPVYVRGDQALLVQVLINLVINAMDSLEGLQQRPDAPTRMPPIELKGDVSPHDEIHVRVVDRGCGIPEAQLDQLFDSFHTSKAHGMGLGLSISRSIISAHGGRILATNNAGPGVTFHIFLPPYSEH